MSSKFDRTAYKKTAAAKGVKLLSDRDSQKIKSEMGGGFAPRVKMKENGTYYFRIMPAPNPNDPVFYTESMVYLPCEVIKDGKKEIKQKPIFTADYHAPKPEQRQRDLVKTYISFVDKYAKDRDLEGDELDEFLKPVKGVFGDKKYPGIMPRANTVCHVKTKEGKIEMLQLSPYAFAKIEALNVFVDEDGDTYYDVLTDIDTGSRLKVVKQNKGDSKQIEYIYSEDTPNARKGETLEDYHKAHAVTDEDFETLGKYKSLKERFVDAYGRKDLQFAIEGLGRFDKEHKFGVFDDEEFKKELEEIIALFPETEDEKRKEGKDVAEAFDKVEKKKKPAPAPEPEEEEHEEEEDDDDELTAEQAELARLLQDDDE